MVCQLGTREIDMSRNKEPIEKYLTRDRKMTLDSTMYKQLMTTDKLCKQL